MKLGSRQKSAVAGPQGLGSEGADRIQEFDFRLDLKATKEMILREAEYVLAVLSEDRAFWDDVACECLMCPRCGERFNSQTIYLSLVSPDGYLAIK